MKPKPFASLNHFTVPCVTVQLSFATAGIVPGRAPSCRDGQRPVFVTGCRIRRRTTARKKPPAGSPEGLALLYRTSTCYRINASDALGGQGIQGFEAPAALRRYSYVTALVSCPASTVATRVPSALRTYRIRFGKSWSGFSNTTRWYP